MTSKEAEQTLSLIRGMMERSTRYTNLSGHAGIAAGVATLVGCALRLWFNTPFLSTWIGVLIAATAASLYFTAAMAKSNGEPPWSRQAQTVALAFTSGQERSLRAALRHHARINTQIAGVLLGRHGHVISTTSLKSLKIVG